MRMEALQAREDLMKSIQNFLKKFNRISFRETPKVLMQAWDKFFEVKHAQSEEVQELLNKLLQDLQSINEELAEYINTPSWNLPTSSYDDDDDEYSFATQEYLMTCSTTITPDSLKTDSLIMVDKHLDTIPETESDEFIKSSVENLVQNPSESEDEFRTVNSTRIVNREHEEYISLLERLLYDNSSPRPPEDFHTNLNMIIESLPIFPTPVEDSDSLREEIDIFPGPDDLIPPGIESDEYDSERDEDTPEITIDLRHGCYILIHENLFEFTIRVTPKKNVKKTTNASLILEDFNPPLYELPFHKEVPGSETLLSFSSENEEKVFNPRILTSKGVHTSLLLELSHRGPKAFKVIKIFESPMEIFPCSYGEDIRVLDVPIAPDFEASRARGFVLRSLELHILSFILGIQYPNLID
ncbi:hypothetical protein Tco_0650434 [Tanacetum coccineum]